jgi:MFS family permease
MACGFDKEKSSMTEKYEIDWNSDVSLHNWMTDLNLMCTEPYIIGLLGAISFISFSFGSILFTGISDKYGRRPVVIIASLVTPLGAFSTLFAKNIATLYSIIFIMSLSYNARGSTAYIYGTEFL